MIVVNLAEQRGSLVHLCNCGTELTYKLAIFGPHLYCEKCKDFVSFTIKEVEKECQVKK